MGIDLPATEGSVEPPDSATPIESPASARSKRPAKAKSSKPRASAPAIPPADAGPAKKKAVQKPGKKAVARASAPAAKTKGATTKTTAQPKKKTPVGRTETGTNGEITPELIAIRAFLVWEKRAQQGLPGDEVSDWVEAERQLLAERLQS